MISEMTKTKSTFGNAIVLARYRPDTNSLTKALDLGLGFQVLPAI
jgi:hypothetical protein